MKNYKFTFLFIFSMCGLLHFSCSESTVAENLTIVKGFNYQPLEIGKFVTYELDTVIYRTQTGGDCQFAIDSSFSYLREEVVDIFVDNTGKENFIIERYTRKNLTDPWEVADVWNTAMSDSQVERVEENLRFIKMVFPVTEGVSWNGNSFFQDTSVIIGGEVIEFYQHWSNEYQYGTVDVPEEINGITFDSVATVIQSAPSENKINHRSSIEKYARGVGLVYKEMLILDTQCCISPDSLGLGLIFCDDIPWEVKAEKGLILRQRVIDFN